MDELEQSLLARWDRETLLVYADHLQAKGDPRGELIALDLEAAVRGLRRSSRGAAASDCTSG